MGESSQSPTSSRSIRFGCSRWSPALRSTKAWWAFRSVCQATGGACAAERQLTGAQAIQYVQLAEDVGPHAVEQFVERQAVVVVEQTWQQPCGRVTSFQQCAVIVGGNPAYGGRQGPQIPDSLRRSGVGKAFSRLSIHARQQPTESLVAPGTDASSVKPVEYRDQRKERTAVGIDLLCMICDVLDVRG